MCSKLWCSFSVNNLDFVCVCVVVNGPFREPNPSRGRLRSAASVITGRSFLKLSLTFSVAGCFSPVRRAVEWSDVSSCLQTERLVNIYFRY